MSGANVVLVGMMGSGKTSVGRNLAQKLGWDFLDFDDFIEKNEGRKISEIFAIDGEERFRELETQAIKEFVGTHTVIATGGGAMQKEENVALLEKIGTTIYLYAPAEALWERVQNQTHHRPLAKGDFKDFKALLERREPMYRRVCVVVETQNKPVASIVEEICEKING